MATTLQPSKDKIVDDLKSLISDAEELLKLTADQQGGKLDDLRARINGRVAVAKDRLADAEAAIVDTGKKAVRATDDYVHENPWQSVGVAAGVAFLLGLLVSRRCVDEHRAQGAQAASRRQLARHRRCRPADGADAA